LTATIGGTVRKILFMPTNAQSFISQFPTTNAAVQSILSQARSNALSTLRTLPGLDGALAVKDWTGLNDTQANVPHTGDSHTPGAVMGELHAAIQAALRGRDASTLFADLWLWYVAMRPR
jgi:hypothetical protein